ncbi:flagellar biosynthesis protein FlhB [Buchnera aphidicola]|uniref:flagellar biosynthesis protein FlhB n=1 Tax=Buchnera aphidicola TaxID=9 RepID=UPI0034645D7B
MNDNINEDKTEKPTEYHIKKFRKKGETKYSRELNAVLILLCSSVILWWCKEKIFFQFCQIMLHSLSFNSGIIKNKKDMILDFLFYLKEVIISFFPFFLCIVLIIIFPSIFFSGIQFNFRSLKFDLNKINPILGFKKIFSFKIIIEFFKLIFKILLIGSIAYWYLFICFSQVFILLSEYPQDSFLHGFRIICNCCVFMILGLIPIVILDVIWKEFSYYKKLKMTHQEKKDEYKETEGNPNIKMRIRQRMKLIANRRMMADIPKADVIITNPIHYSIALKYDYECMSAPQVIAKGTGIIAVQIQKIGMKYDISIISAPSLARSLYRYSEIGQYIPGPLYKAVAEVLAWVWKVKQWKKEGGVVPKKPKNISVPSDLNFTGQYKKNG